MKSLSIEREKILLSGAIYTAPCHIASLPVAVSIQCHSCRRMTETI